MVINERQRRDRFERDYVFVAALFAVLMVLTNLIGTKLFLLFPTWLPEGFGALTGHGFVVLTTGLVTYPLTFLFTDVCSEVYGRRRANYMVLLGFLASLLMLAVVHVAAGVPRADRFWADAAQQPVQGTELLQTVEAGADRLPVDDALYLLATEGLSAKAALLLPEGPLFVTYVGLERPTHPVPDGAGGVQVEPLRWDHRGSLRLQRPLERPVPAGTWVVPAVTVAERHEDGAIRVDRAVNLPPSGTLVAASGAAIDYDLRDATGRLVPEGDAVAELTPGTPLAVVNQFTPSQLQKNLTSIISAPGILLVSSMLAYLVAQFLDVWLYHFWRRVTRGRFLWLRNNGSTMISQLVDTIIVNGIFLTVAFGMESDAVINVIVAVYIVKMVLAWLDTPLIYLGVWIAKRRLGLAWTDEVDDDLLMNQPKEVL